MWSYSLGLQEGYVPADPRAYHGACPAMAEKYNLPPPAVVSFDGSLEPWMTGGAGAGQIVPTQIAS
jgi:glucan 1,3-beta-glucosidase